MRFVHSIVMGMLFRKESILQKIKNALMMAKDHGVRLGIYVLIFKFIVGVFELAFKR